MDEVLFHSFASLTHIGRHALFLGRSYYSLNFKIPAVIESNIEYKINSKLLYKSIV